MSRRPNLFVVGAARAGTTSLYNYLSRHPDVYMSPRKEPHYFSQIEPSPRLKVDFRRIASDEEYLGLFQDASDERYVGEASPSYLWSPRAARAIKAFDPEARIIVSLREPVTRAFSQYLQRRERDCTEERTFVEAIEEELRHPLDAPVRFDRLYVAVGAYCEQVERYLDEFGSQVHVLFFEEFFDDVETGLKGLYGSLGLDVPEVATGPQNVFNAYSKPRNQLARSFLGSPNLRSLARRVVPQRLRPQIRQALLTYSEKPNIETRAGELLSHLYSQQKACLEDLLGRAVPW